MAAYSNSTVALAWGIALASTSQSSRLHPAFALCNHSDMAICNHNHKLCLMCTSPQPSRLQLSVARQGAKQGSKDAADPCLKLTSFFPAITLLLLSYCALLADSLCDAGQGVNQGLEDAVELAYFLKQGGLTPHSLRKFEASRIPRLQEIMACEMVRHLPVLPVCKSVVQKHLGMLLLQVITLSRILL